LHDGVAAITIPEYILLSALGVNVAAVFKVEAAVIMLGIVYAFLPDASVVPGEFQCRFLGSFANLPN